MEYLEPWENYENDSSASEKELTRELCKEHVLYGVKVKAVAHRCDCDDVLFELSNFSHKYAVVHLTFSREKDPSYPSFELYNDIEAWVSGRMKPDNDEYR